MNSLVNTVVRSWIRNLHSRRNPSSPSTKFRPTCLIHVPSGSGMIPATCGQSNNEEHMVAGETLRGVQKLVLSPSCDFHVVVVEQTSQAFPTLQFPRFTSSEVSLNEVVVQPLVIPFSVVLEAKLLNRSPPRSFPHQNQMIQALGLDRPGESFGSPAFMLAISLNRSPADTG